MREGGIRQRAAGSRERAASSGQQAAGSGQHASARALLQPGTHLLSSSMTAIVHLGQGFNRRDGWRKGTGRTPGTSPCRQPAGTGTGSVQT